MMYNLPITLVFTSLLAFIGKTTATLNEARQAPSQYYLQTSLVDPDGDPFKNGLYVYSYHTGAGLSDAVLTSNISIAEIGFLNGTYQQFDIGSTQIQWGMHPTVMTPYSAWQPVQINAHMEDDGFFVNSTGLQWSEEYGFAGWLACDWWHGEPQLFWKVSRYQDTLPCNCADVELKVVAP